MFWFKISKVHFRQMYPLGTSSIVCVGLPHPPLQSLQSGNRASCAMCPGFCCGLRLVWVLPLHILIVWPWTCDFPFLGVSWILRTGSGMCKHLLYISYSPTPLMRALGLEKVTKHIPWGMKCSQQVFIRHVNIYTNLMNKDYKSSHH